MPVTKIKTNWNAGDLEFRDASGNVILTLKSATRELAIAVGAVFSVAGAAFSAIRTINLAAATQVLTALQSGQKFVAAVDAVFTLPSAAVAGMAGVWYEFECGALSAGTGFAISPNASDAIGGNGLGVVLDKDLINSGASDRLGDMVRIYCTGVAGATAWRIESVIGTFAKEA